MTDDCLYHCETTLEPLEPLPSQGFGNWCVTPMTGTFCRDFAMNLSWQTNLSSRSYGWCTTLYWHTQLLMLISFKILRQWLKIVQYRSLYSWPCSVNQKSSLVYYWDFRFKRTFGTLWSSQLLKAVLALEIRWLAALHGFPFLSSSLQSSPSGQLGMLYLPLKILFPAICP